MTRRWRPASGLFVCAVILSGCRSVPDPAAPQTDCGATDPRIGWVAELRTWMHGVRGTARIVDNCTIVIEHFYYDGIGLDVRVIGVHGDDYWNGIPLTSDIRRIGGYTDATLTVTLPEGVTLDDVPRISISCGPVGANFGDGTFAPPAE